MKKLLKISTEQLYADKGSQFITIGIKGEAGMGKSRLVSEFIKRNQCNYIRAGASNIHSRPYFIFISLLLLSLLPFIPILIYIFTLF